MELITRDPEILGGTPCFTGTRVPVQYLFEYLENGHSLEYFVRQFPSVSLEVARAVLKSAADLLVQPKTRKAG